VRKLYRRLCAAGAQPWLDEENLLPGVDWDSEIRKAVRSSDAVIVCLSRSSVTKAGYIQKEINQILDLADEQPQDTIFVIPLKLEECEIPARISRWQWVNFFDERGFERLLRSLYNRAENVGAALVSSRQPANVKASARETVVSHEDPNILIDPATGLMWTRRHNNEDINWIKASEYAKNLSLGGYADWRLPTIEELERLSDPQRGHGFKIREPFKLEKPRIWSSTKKTQILPCISISSLRGGVPALLKSSLSTVLCVCVVLESQEDHLCGNLAEGYGQGDCKQKVIGKTWAR
jgi:TIR domain-containing protein/uncharacterized protein DUF1566